MKMVKIKIAPMGAAHFAPPPALIADHLAEVSPVGGTEVQFSIPKTTLVFEFQSGYQLREPDKELDKHNEDITFRFHVLPFPKRHD